MSAALQIVLTPQEQTELQAIERRISANVSAIGTELATIRNKRLYRAYGSFETYCEQRWGFSRQRAYQMMQASTVLDNMSKIVDTLPQVESQLRELAKLDTAEKQVLAFVTAAQHAQETGQQLSAKLVKQAVDVVSEVDTTGAVEAYDQITSTARRLQPMMTEDSYERYQRQREHIEANAKRKCINEERLTGVTASQILSRVQTCSFNAFVKQYDDGRMVIVLDPQK